MATQTGTIINLVNTALGAGMLALPFAFRAQGIALSIFSLLFGAFTTGVGLLLLSYTSGFLASGTASFFQIAKITYPSLAVVFDVAIAFKCFGVCISYLVIVGDLMPMVAAYFGFETGSLFWLVVAMLIVVPISFYRNLDSLKTASLIALSSVVYLVIIVVGHFLRGDTVDQKGPVAYFEPKGFSNVVSTIPIIVFAFTCAQNMYAAVNELESRTPKSLIQITLATTGISAGVYILVGLTGYLSFGDNVSDNVISMYAQSVWSTLGRFAIVVLVLFSYPIMCHPARASISNVLNAVRSHKSPAETTEPETNAPLLPTHSLTNGDPANPESAANAQPSDDREYIIVTTLLLVLSFVLAQTLNSLELILSFVGATGATGVSFILPGIFGYALADSDRANSLVELTPRQKKAVKIASVLLSSWGTLVAVLAIGVNIYRLIS